MEKYYQYITPSSSIGNEQHDANEPSPPASTYGVERSAAGPEDCFPQARIPVVPSMLYAYASMRGNQDAGVDPDEYRPVDPLHQALFAQEDPLIESMPVFLTTLDEEDLDTGLSGKTKFYWDPNQPEHEFPHKRTSGISHSFPAQCYQDFKENIMPHLIPNHHHGEAGLEDAGYFKVNGKWVDPDSEHELHAAFTGTAVEKSPELPLSNKGGPKTMNWEEQEEYYKWYIAEVTDCDDREGDPRVQGISSQTFKAWACGAVKGDKYVTEQVPPQELWRGRKVEPSDKPKFDYTIPHSVVYDIETGSMMSGWSGQSSFATPTLCYSSRGVDPLKKPTDFDRMLPEVGRILDRAKYGNPDDDRVWLKSTSSVDAEPLKLQDIHMNLLETDGYVDGDENFDYFTEAVLDSRRLVEREARELGRLASKNEKRTAEVTRLSKQNHFLQAYLDTLPKKPELRRSRHVRILTELKEQNEMTAKKLKERQKVARETREKSKRDVRELRKEEAELFKTLKIKDISELPEGIIPKEPEKSDWRF